MQDAKFSDSIHKTFTIIELHMIKVKQISELLESWAPISLQENYDNAGLLTGNSEQEVTKILVTLDCTEEVIDEAIHSGCNLIVAHHPIIFKGLKKLNGKNYVERTVIKAIKNDIAIYAIHTNLDNVANGVNAKIADKIGLKNTRILAPLSHRIKKLVVFVPLSHLDQVKAALFQAGCGSIGNYAECSFELEGKGYFKPLEGSIPFLGEKGHSESVIEVRLETVFAENLQNQVVKAIKQAHPYEEPAYDIFLLENENSLIGAGLIGELPQPLSHQDFLKHVAKQMEAPCIKYTNLEKELILRVAVCGGAGSFLIKNAIASDADAFVTGDVKYHEFFDAENQLMITDIGHYESEFFTKELIKEVIIQKFPTFAVLLSNIKTNPINYFNS